MKTQYELILSKTYGLHDEEKIRNATVKFRFNTLYQAKNLSWAETDGLKHYPYYTIMKLTLDGDKVIEATTIETYNNGVINKYE